MMRYQNKSLFVVSPASSHPSTPTLGAAKQSKQVIGHGLRRLSLLSLKGIDNVSSFAMVRQALVKDNGPAIVRILQVIETREKVPLAEERYGGRRRRYFAHWAWRDDVK